MEAICGFQPAHHLCSANHNEAGQNCSLPCAWTEWIRNLRRGSTSRRATNQSQSQWLYPSLQSHWQELGIPLTSTGEIDVMQVQVMYHFGRNCNESENDYRSRMGIDAYISENKVTKMSQLFGDKSNVFCQKKVFISKWLGSTRLNNIRWHFWTGGRQSVPTYFGRSGRMDRFDLCAGAELPVSADGHKCQDLHQQCTKWVKTKIGRFL